MRGTLTAFSWVKVPTRSTFDHARHLPQRFDLVVRNADLEAVDGALEAADDVAARGFDLPAFAGLLGAAIAP